MDIREIIRNALKDTEALTPLRFDCGRLCGAACCQGSEAGRGMLLYPGEAAVQTFPPSWRRERVALPDYGPALLLCCDGPCDRAGRPLACRVFPLGPLLREDGSFGVRMNARGRPVCPLCRRPVSCLDRAFTRAVAGVFNDLAGDPEGRRFLTALSRHIDRFEDPLGVD